LCFQKAVIATIPGFYAWLVGGPVFVAPN